MDCILAHVSFLEVYCESATKSPNNTNLSSSQQVSASSTWVSNNTTDCVYMTLKKFIILPRTLKTQIVTVEVRLSHLDNAIVIQISPCKLKLNPVMTGQCLYACTASLTLACAPRRKSDASSTHCATANLIVLEVVFLQQQCFVKLISHYYLSQLQA